MRSAWAARRLESAGDTQAIMVKELTEVANRRRFHLEKFVFAATAAGMFVFFVWEATSRGGVSLQTLASSGRSLFFALSLASWGMLSLVVLASATGIISSEALGRRLDLLRVTPLSLKTIVFAKAFAVMARALLVLTLLVPVMATAQMAGGVAQADVVKAFVLVLSDLFLFTCIGVCVSAGAETEFDRFARSGEAIFGWFFVTGLLAGFAGGLIRRLSPAAICPPVAWIMLSEGRLAWGSLAVHVAASAGGGLFFLRWAVGDLVRSILRRDMLVKEEPKVGWLVGDRRRPWRARRSSSRVKRAVVRLYGLASGTLPGGQIAQTSAVTLLAPLITVFPPAFMWALVAVFGPWNSPSGILLVAAVLLSAALSLVVGLQACGTIASERRRHTAEVLATTPAGGPRMLLWKGEGVFAVHLLSLAGLVVIAVLAARDGMIGPQAAAAWLAALGGLLLLLYALGSALSLSAKTPAAAAVAMAVTLLVIVPFVTTLAADASGWHVAPTPYGQADRERIVLIILAASTLVLLFRNLVPSLSTALVSLATAGALAAMVLFGFCGAYPDVAPWQYAAGLYLPAMMNPRAAADFGWAAAATDTFVAAALLAGSVWRFKRLFPGRAGGGGRGE